MRSYSDKLALDLALLDILRELLFLDIDDLLAMATSDLSLSEN